MGQNFQHHKPEVNRQTPTEVEKHAGCRGVPQNCHTKGVNFTSRKQSTDKRSPKSKSMRFVAVFMAETEKVVKHGQTAASETRRSLQTTDIFPPQEYLHCRGVPGPNCNTKGSKKVRSVQRVVPVIDLARLRQNQNTTSANVADNDMFFVGTRLHVK